MPHFEKKESYLHYYAKLILKGWIKKYPKRFGVIDLASIRTEEKFCESGIVLFTPDITVYNKNGLSHIFEVEHSSPVTLDRIFNMQLFFFENEMNPLVHEISAEYIITKLRCPDEPLMKSILMFDDGQLF